MGAVRGFLTKCSVQCSLVAQIACKDLVVLGILFPNDQLSDKVYTRIRNESCPHTHENLCVHSSALNTLVCALFSYMHTRTRSLPVLPPYVCSTGVSLSVCVLACA